MGESYPYAWEMGARGMPLPKNLEKIFLGSYHIKFGHFGGGGKYVKIWAFYYFSYIYFWAKMSCPQS